MVRKLRKSTALERPSLVAAALTWRNKLRLPKGLPLRLPLRVQNTKSFGCRCLLAFHLPIRALFLADVVALERAVDLISEGYFDGHDVLFADSQKELTSSHETARFLIVGYNCFAEENGKEPIDTEAIERSPGRKVHHFLNEWVMLSRSKVLVARGEIFAARDEVLALLKTDDPGTDR
jgi:hypothetical protein